MKIKKVCASGVEKSIYDVNPCQQTGHNRRMFLRHFIWKSSCAAINGGGLVDGMASEESLLGL